MKPTDAFQNVNTSAMLGGILLGAWGIAGLALSLFSLSRPLFSFPADVVTILSPFLAAALTIRFRQRTTAPGEAFSFRSGYLHTLLLGLYACVWIALAVYAYFAYADGGALCEALEKMLSRPDVAQAIAQMEALGYFDELYADTGAESITQFVDVLRELTPANFAGMVVTTTLITAPIISLFVALLTMRRAAR